MARMMFGDVEESVVTRDEVSLDTARGILADETIAVIGYGVQGPAQAMNLRDNGFRVIIGQRQGGASWEKAITDGWEPGETLFSIEEAAKRGTIILNLLSDAFCGLTSEFFQRFIRSETGQSLKAHDLDHLQITMRDGKAPKRLQ